MKQLVIAILSILSIATTADAHWGKPSHNMQHMKAGFVSGTINYHHGKDPSDPK